MGSHKKILNEQEREKYLSNFYKIYNFFIDENLSNDEKVYSFLKMYPTIKKFEYDYEYYLDKCGDYPNKTKDLKIINYLYEQIKKFEENKLISNLQYILKIENKLNTYEFAEFVISSYIARDSIIDINVFFKDLDIDKDIFDYCLKVISLLNPTLYKAYDKKRIENIHVRYYNLVNTFKELAKEIKTGVQPDGTPFDSLRFWYLIPFKDNRNLSTELFEYKKYVNQSIDSKREYTLYGNVKKFLKYLLPEEYKIIINYMVKHSIRTCTHISAQEIIKDQESVIEQVRILKNGEEQNIKLSEKDIKQIFKYMKYYNLPYISQVYNILRERYINGDKLIVPNHLFVTTVETILDEELEDQKEFIINSLEKTRTKK